MVFPPYAEKTIKKKKETFNWRSNMNIFNLENCLLFAEYSGIILRKL